MSLTVSENSGVSNIPILPEGSYVAVCYLLADIGLQYSERYKKSTPKVVIGWELPGEFVEVDGEQRPRIFSTRYTASLNEKAILRRDLAAWRGRDFTDAELKQFDLKNIVGAPCLIQIIHKESSGGRMFATLASIMKIPAGMPVPKRTLEPIVYDIDENDPGDVNKLPEWIADMVRASESYKDRTAVPEGFEEISSDEDLPF